MDLFTTAALILLLCSLNTGALPFRNSLVNYQQDDSGNIKQGSFVKNAAAVETRNENLPCQVFPDVDDPLTSPPPFPVQTPGPRPAPPPPNILYQPVMPYYVLQYPVRGGSHVFGQGADNNRFVQGGVQPLPHLPVSASGYLPAPRWFLDLQKEKHFPTSPKSNPTGNERHPIGVKSFASASSETSSEEDND